MSDEKMRPAPQTVKLDPVILSPESGAFVPAPGKVVALFDDEKVVTWDPGKVLDLEAMDQALISAGVPADVRQDALKQAAEAQIQFLALQLSTITWFLREGGDALDETFIVTPIQLKTVAYDHGRMEVTFRMGAPDDAPEGQTQESEADEAATAEPAPNEGGSPLQEPRNIASRSESPAIR